MAGPRDQAARVVRPEPEAAEGEAAREASVQLADQLRSHVDESKRRPAETPADPPSEQAAAPPAEAAPKSGRRKFVMMGMLGLLALAAVGYGTYYVLVGRFY